jgi:hypothetical protein
LEKLITVINEIAKYGLNSNLNLNNKEHDLEKYLVSLYALYFQIEFGFDEIFIKTLTNLNFLILERMFRQTFMVLVFTTLL